MEERRVCMCVYVERYHLLLSDYVHYYHFRLNRLQRSQTSKG